MFSPAWLFSVIANISRPRHSRRYDRRRPVYKGVIGGLGVALLVFASLTAPALGAGGVRLAVLGDSLTAGYGLMAEDAFPTQLEVRLHALGVDIAVMNAGVSGDTSAGGRSRLDWLLGDAPDIVIIELGANDALRGLEPSATADNLDAIITRLRAEGLTVMLAGMLAPPNLGADYGREFNALYSRLVRKHGVAYYPFFLDGVAAQPALNQADGIHPNAAGVAVIVERIVPYVRALVEQHAAARSAD